MRLADVESGVFLLLSGDDVTNVSVLLDDVDANRPLYVETNYSSRSSQTRRHR